jgi:hypothetical protein
MEEVIDVALLRVLILAAVLSGTAIAGDSGTDLYVIQKIDSGSLGLLSNNGYRIRLVSDGYVLCELESYQAERLMAAGFELGPVSIVGEGEYFIYQGPLSQVKDLEYRVLPDMKVLLRGKRSELDPLGRHGENMTELPATASLRTLIVKDEPEFLRAAELRKEATDQVVQGIMESVSVDSLMKFVTVLSEDTLGYSRTRFVHCTEYILKEALPYITHNLQNYVIDNGGTVRNILIDWSGASNAFNVEAILPGTGEVEGCFLLGAHYDAISETAYRCKPPKHSAPGADDNATGVACVLEAARVLSGYDFPFDLRFVLFTAEELGLYGSKDYAEDAAEDSMKIIGVLNFDMVAYTFASQEDSVIIYTSPASRWIADWMEETVVEYSLGAKTNTIEDMFAGSDHFHFWQQGYDAIFATEAANPRNNPYYHTTADTAENISPEHLLKAAEVLIASIARFVETPVATDFVMNPGDITYEGTQNQDLDEIYVGDELEIQVRVRNLGEAAEGTLILSIWDGLPGDGGKKLDEAELDPSSISVSSVIAEFSWKLDGIDPGTHYLAATAKLVGGQETNTSNNSAFAPVLVRSEQLIVVDDFVWPNPVTGNMSSATLRYELSSEASVKVELLDLEGQVLASWENSHRTVGTPEENLGVLAGANDLPFDALEGSLSSISSGIYMYRIAAFSENSNDPDQVVIGKFAFVK